MRYQTSLFVYFIALDRDDIDDFDDENDSYRKMDIASSLGGRQTGQTRESGLRV